MEGELAVSALHVSVGEQEWQPEAAGITGSLAVVLAKEFPESFRWAQEVTASARKCIRLEYSAPHCVEAQVEQLFADLQDLKKRLLSENFYFRVVELELESTPEVLDLAKISADWRIVLLFSFLDEELPQFEQEYDYAMNLLAANSEAIAEGTGKLRPSFETAVAAMAA